MIEDTLTGLLFKVILTLLFVAVPIVWLLLKIKKLTKEENQNSRSPFSEKLLRPAGESLRLRIDEINSKLWDQILELVLLLFYPALVIIFLPKMNWSASLSVILIAAIICGIFTRKKWQAIVNIKDELRKYELGFHAERVVASELEQLRAVGYQVFHDIIDDSRPGGEKTNYNIDHIVVGPQGVFVIETKGKRKATPLPTSTLKEHQLAFDGKQLSFPNGTVTEQPIQQAKQNAQFVEKWLATSVSGELPCRAIVAYPGWFVKNKDGKINGVQPAKGLAKRIPSLGRGRQLEPHEVSALAARIEDKSRDVDSV